jgi:hypothetical protein
VGAELCSVEPSESPGSVFVSQHDDTTTFWVIERIDRDAHSSSYSRTTPGHHARSVRVRCEDRPGGHRRVVVEYDMTNLSPENAHALDAYDSEHVVAMLTEGQERRREPLDAPVQGHVVHVDSALIDAAPDPVGPCVPQAPAHREQDHIRREPNPSDRSVQR